MKEKQNIILVLGCRISEDGSLKSVIERRIQRAYELFLKDQKHSVFLLSGGQGSDEGCSEAEAMCRYLMQKGVPKGKIYLEDKSTSTYENMKFSKEKMREENLHGNLYLVTTYPHLVRSQMYARLFYLRAKGIGSMAKPHLMFKMAIREIPAIFVAFIKCRHRK